MNFTLIVGVLLFIVVVYLIFKFIKKVVFAIISVFILIVLIISGIGLLAYMDFQSLASQSDFNVKLVYEQDNSFLYGVQIPFENASPLTEQVSGISNPRTIDVDSIEKDSGEFVVIINDVLFEELIRGKTFTFDSILAGGDFEQYNLTFSDTEILEVMNSNTPEDTMLDIIFEKANIPSFLIESAKPIAKEMLETTLEEQGLTTKEILFILTLNEVMQDEENLISLVEGFKNDELQVYPQRITFDLIKFIPASALNLEFVE